MNKYDLLNRIEELRQSMYKLIAKENNLTHIEIINVSQQLDLALNEYNRLLSFSFNTY